LYSIDVIKSYIQEWFSEALNPVEVAKTYHEIQQEAEKQLEFMMEQKTISSENLILGGRKKMNGEEKQAYEWAKNQNYQSVATRYSKILADYIDHIRDLMERAAEEIENVYGKETVLSEKIKDSLN